jgi:hypothetical protein
MAVHTRQRASTSLIFQALGLRDIPIDPRFLGRPRLLTRLYPLPWEGDISRPLTISILHWLPVALGSPGPCDLRILQSLINGGNTHE